MNDAKFTELLNLYLDHEISAEDAALLEAEVQGNPARRRVYLEYCQMHNACTVLGRRFKAESPEAFAHNLITRRPAARTAWETGLYATGVVAAAACLAIIFALRQTSHDAAGSATTNVPLAATDLGAPVGALARPAAVAAEIGSSPLITTGLSVPTRRDQLQQTLVTNPFLFSGRTDVPGMFAETGESPDAPPLDWMRSVSLAPVPPGSPGHELRFDARPMTLRPDAGSFDSHSPGDPDVELTAFRFVK